MSLIKVVKRSPVLVSKTRTGADKFWANEVVKISNKYYLRTEHWQTKADGTDSKHQFSEPYLVSGKNIGRSNETSDEEQSLLEFDSGVKKYRDKGYNDIGVKSTSRPLPMLAQKFKERKGKIDWNSAYAQPKLDGSRMLFDGTTAWSRGGKNIIPEVIEHLVFDTDGHIIDGELILPGNVKLQETMKATKKYRKGVSDQLMYMVYDLVESDMVFSERYALLASLVKNAPENVILVETMRVTGEEDVNVAQVHFVKEGYEGTMVRDDSCGYDIGHRSNSLQKMKDFQDEEFKIVDVVEGSGSDTGCAIFICKAENGETFRARIEGSREESRETFKTRKNHINKFLTVRFQAWTNRGVPQFPVGVGVREKGDF